MHIQGAYTSQVYLLFHILSGEGHMEPATLDQVMLHHLHT